MVYGYCTDQTDGTSFIGGVFDASATSYPYSAGLAIGGTSGNLLWKGSKVLSANDLGFTTSATNRNYAVKADANGDLYVNVPWTDTNTHAVSSVNGKTGAVSLTYSDVGAAKSSHNHTWSDISDRASCTINTSGTITGSKVYGAVWNDYAEYRWVLKDKATDKMPEPGRCVVENGNDSMSISNGRLQPGAKIISDTYGMCMGETEKAKTPIAVCGRVLAHPFERKIAFNVGDAVCSGPNGTVSRMTREEIMMYPERIVGTVVSKPTYKEWGPNKIPVNGRIWIQVK